MSEGNVPEANVLSGRRRELTRELFEELGALQCEPEEILGFIGTDEESLDAWCQNVYDLGLKEILPMVRQDGLIEIRRASFDALRKSAPLIQQQYNRYLSSQAEEKEREARERAKQVFAKLTLGEEAKRELFEDAL